jgi:hypothetical protein
MGNSLDGARGKHWPAIGTVQFNANIADSASAGSGDQRALRLEFNRDDLHPGDLSEHGQRSMAPANDCAAQIGCLSLAKISVDCPGPDWRIIEVCELLPVSWRDCRSLEDGGAMQYEAGVGGFQAGAGIAGGSVPGPAQSRTAVLVSYYDAA